MAREKTKVRYVALDNNDMAVINDNSNLSQFLTGLGEVDFDNDKIGDDNPKNFTDRIEAIYQAYQFFCQSQGPIPRDINLDNYKPNSEDDFITCQNKLSQFKDQVIQHIMQDYKCDKKHAEEYLDKAEQYHNLGQKRGELVTVSKLPGGQFIVQREMPQPPFSDKTKKELMAIKQNSSQPFWFENLDSFEKKLLRKVLDEHVEQESDLDDFSISSKLRTLKGVANSSIHEMILYSENGEELCRRKAARSSAISSRDVEKVKGLSKDKKDKLHSEHARHNFQQAIATTFKEDHEDINSGMAVKLKKMHEEGLLKEVEVNSKKVYVATMPILCQTLITPLPIPGKPDLMLYQKKSEAVETISKFHRLPEKMEVELDDLNNTTTVLINYEFLNTNHAVNIGRCIDLTTTVGDTGKACQKILSLATDVYSNLDKESGKAKRLANLMTAYSGLLMTTLSSDKIEKEWNSETSRELFLASFEQLIIGEIGGIAPGSSCVSGKDRKGLESILSDAITAYYQIHGIYPAPLGQNEEFAKIFAAIYLSNHQSINSSQNAKGVVGLKTPDMYLPKYLCDAIKLMAKENGIASYPHILKQHDRVATNNDIKKIKSLDPTHFYGLSTSMLSNVKDKLIPRLSTIIAFTLNENISMVKQAQAASTNSSVTREKIAQKIVDHIDNIKAKQYKERIDGYLQNEARRELFIKKFLARDRNAYTDSFKKFPQDLQENLIKYRLTQEIRNALEPNMNDVILHDDLHKAMKAIEEAKEMFPWLLSQDFQHYENDILRAFDIKVSTPQLPESRNLTY